MPTKPLSSTADRTFPWEPTGVGPAKLRAGGQQSLRYPPSDPKLMVHQERGGSRQTADAKHNMKAKSQTQRSFRYTPDRNNQRLDGTTAIPGIHFLRMTATKPPPGARDMEWRVLRLASILSRRTAFG